MKIEVDRRIDVPTLGQPHGGLSKTYDRCIADSMKHSIDSHENRGTSNHTH